MDKGGVYNQQEKWRGKELRYKEESSMMEVLDKMGSRKH